MSYAALAVVLFLWIYDRNLLVRLQRRIYREFKAMIWTILKMYTEMKNKNDQIKDGYHVDSVFLHEFQSSSFVRKLDVLRRFREEIVNETFTQSKSVNIWDFIEMCTEEGSNFGKVDRNLYHELEVNYTMDRKQYKIIFSTQNNSNVRFPIYTEKEVRQRKEAQGIISAIVVQNEEDDEGIDVTDSLLKFAGPMENFYSDTEYIVKRCWLSQVNIDTNAIIKVLDMDAEEHIFSPLKEIITFKNKD